MIAAFGPATTVDRFFYRYRGGGGWQLTAQLDCEMCEYGVAGRGSGAVVCVRVVKARSHP